ncbi:hypothetical protein COLO4_25847 [Corchorus olitorius]|uniref:Fibronectin type III-like domain-containing protein n=1 Tax=Corchorus olitorius TaxID=93759 RepID=A0A1R3HZX7_9ROSI|nr:hypothetical protein COLO4_25847 [Corchorus olitorius]
MAEQKLNVFIITLFLVIINLFTICSADAPELKPVQTHDLYVCNPERFYGLSMNMSELAFCDKSLPYEVRAKDLIDRMTLREKALQLGHKTPGVPRLGLPRYNWWSEGLHGVSFIGNGTNFTDIIPTATSFPTVIHTTASFNKSLWKTIGKAVSTEARAFHNVQQGGLSFWSPVINPVRDPRWGRTTETPGEDPFVVGVYATNYVRGLQDIEGQEQTEDPASRPLKVSACCKHYAAYDVDNWKGVIRESYDAQVAEQDMVETFVRPFEMCVKDGEASSVMCSYNKVNGIPTCADPVLLKETIRQEWKFNGYIVADCDAVEVMVDKHHWLNDKPEDAVAQTLKAGLDLDCGDYFPDHLENSVKQGKVKESEMDKALKYLYVVLMRLGFFDGSDPSLMKIGKNEVCSKEHIELAAEAAREGIVLLKNDASTLPLSPDAFKSLAVIGPNANVTRVMLGNYEAAFPCRYVTPIEGLSAFAHVIYENGCENTACNDNKTFPQAVSAAKRADATILIMGSDRQIEEESRDRETLLLPGLQKELITQVTSNSKGPVILVLMTAGGFDISFAVKDPKIKGILWVGHPGQEGGRLPITWYQADYVDKLPMTSMPLRPIASQGYPGRTYKFFNGTTVFPFGYGLSYTTFSYKVTTPPKVSLDIQLDRLQHCHNLEYTDKSLENSCPSVVVNDLTCQERVSFEVEVKNEGDISGSEVIMVYSKPPEGIVGTHIKQVVDFERVFVPAKQSRKVKFDLDLCKSFSIVDDRAYTVLPSGLHKILLGTSNQEIDLNVSFTR